MIHKPNSTDGISVENRKEPPVLLDVFYPKPILQRAIKSPLMSVAITSALAGACIVISGGFVSGLTLFSILAATFYVPFVLGNLCIYLSNLAKKDENKSQLLWGEGFVDGGSAGHGLGVLLNG